MDGDLDVLRGMLRDARAWKRARAAHSLGLGRHAAAVPDLLRAAGDANAVVRESAVIALGRIGDPATVPDLCAALRDPSPDVARAAARSLAGHPTAAALTALLGALDAAPSSVRCEVARCFATWAAAGERELVRRAFPALRRVWTHSAWRPPEWRAFREALARIQADLGVSLPIPAGAPAHEAWDLPLPVPAAEPAAAGLPLPAPDPLADEA